MRFANPLMLWLMAATLPLLAWFLVWTWRRRQRLMTQFIQARLLPTLTTRIAPRRQQLRRILLFLTVTLLFFTLARPQWGYTWEESRRRGLDIVVAIDTSRSMLAEDLAPNRLTRAKLAALDLLRLAQPDRLGLVAFAGTAFLQCPLTLDAHAFRLSLDALDTRIIPQGGTAIAAAIETALSTFKDEANFKTLVLISDGEDHDEGALAAAQAAAKKGLRIFTLGAGTPEGEVLRFINNQGRPEFIKDEEGNAVKSRLNAALLQQIATVANGFYLPLAASDSVQTLYQQGLDPLPKSELGSRLTRRYHERFHWPLGLAILILALEMILPHARRTTAAQPIPTRTRFNVHPLVVIGVTAILLSTANASASNTSALKHYQANRFTEAQQLWQELLESNPNDPRLAYNLGTAAYRAGDYPTASQAFTNALTAPDLALQQRGFYNLGNTLYHMGEATPEIPGRAQLWQQAVQSFQAALQLDPADIDAQNNLEYVQHRLEELELEQQPQDEEQQQDQQDQQDQQQDQQQDPQDQQDQQSEQPEQQQGQDPADGQESPNPQQPPDAPDPQPDSDPSESDQPTTDANPNEPPPSDPSAQPGQDNPDSAPPDAGSESPPPVELGQMTPEQARQLLNSQRDNERALIFLPPTNSVPRPVLRDW